MRLSKINCIAAAVAVCAVAWTASSAQAAPLTFTVDSSQSYVQLAIPNFSYSGFNIRIFGQNATNGNTTTSAWTNTTGNRSFFGGTLQANVGGSLTGQTLNAIQFINGANSLLAINSGNYRPNVAALNTTSATYNNNGAAPGDFGLSIAANILINIQAGAASFSNITYNTAGDNLPGSNGVGSGTFATGTASPTGPHLAFGISGGTVALQGFSVAGSQPVPNTTLSGSDLGVLNNSGGNATYQYTSATNLRITIPVIIPIAINAGSDASPIWINGTASGKLVANAVVPEPSTIALAGLGFAAIVLVRRRKMQSAA